jgi:hypothetical protein
MRARIGMALGHYWGGIVYAIDVIALISALGAIGGLPALLNAVTRYARVAMRSRVAMRWWQGPQSRSRASAVSRHVQ